MQASHEPVAATSENEPGTAGDQVRELLEEHVPLSLIMDLAAPDGPHSQEILDAEGSPELAWWEQA